MLLLNDICLKYCNFVVDNQYLLTGNLADLLFELDDNYVLRKAHCDMFEVKLFFARSGIKITVHVIENAVFFNDKFTYIRKLRINTGVVNFTGGRVKYLWCSSRDIAAQFAEILYIQCNTACNAKGVICTNTNDALKFANKTNVYLSNIVYDKHITGYPQIKMAKCSISDPILPKNIKAYVCKDKNIAQIMKLNPKKIIYDEFYMTDTALNVLSCCDVKSLVILSTLTAEQFAIILQNPFIKSLTLRRLTGDIDGDFNDTLVKIKFMFDDKKTGCFTEFTEKNWNLCHGTFIKSARKV